MKYLLIFIAGLGVGAGIWFGLVPQASPKAGNFNPTGAGTYYLQSPINNTQNTIALSSFLEPGSNIPYTMSYLNSDIEYATINPTGPSNPTGAKSEFISFSGITQNSNGTALLTGVVRGLERSYPYQASSTLAYSTPGQTQLILSTPPQFFNEYAQLRGAQTISGVWSFTTLPTTTVACTDSTQFCNKAYIDAGLNQGAATSTFSNMGLVQLATSIQVASSTASSTLQKPLVIPSKFSTSTPGVQCTGNVWNCIPVANLAGKIAQGWLDLTQAFTFSTTTQYVANVGLFTATSSAYILANSTHNLTLNGVGYAFPSSQGAAGSTFINNGSGVLTSGMPSTQKYTYASTTASALNSNAGGASLTTPTIIGVLSGTFTASSTITFMGDMSCVSGGSTQNFCTVELDANSSSLYTVTPVSGCVALSGTCQFQFVITILANNSTSAQSEIANVSGAKGTAVYDMSSTNTTSVSLSGATNFVVKVGSESGSGNSASINGYSVVVTP